MSCATRCRRRATARGRDRGAAAEVQLGAEHHEAAGAAHRSAFALTAAGLRIGTLVLPGQLTEDVETRVREHLVPALEVTLGAALERDALVAEVVETAALRRSNGMKTAILRAVSHDLRTPLTAILAASDAMRDPDLDPADREELGSLAFTEATRLARLIDQLLHLSKLQAGAAEPHFAPCSLEEILTAAVADQPDASGVRLNLDRDLPRSTPTRSSSSGHLRI